MILSFLSFESLLFHILFSFFFFSLDTVFLALFPPFVIVNIIFIPFLSFFLSFFLFLFLAKIELASWKRKRWKEMSELVEWLASYLGET